MAELNEQLSDREREVLELVAEGAPTKEIGPRLFISPNTVKVHLRNINKKLGAQSRTEAVRIAIEQGIIQIGGGEEPPTEAEATNTLPTTEEEPIKSVNDGPLQDSNGHAPTELAVEMPASQQEVTITSAGTLTQEAEIRPVSVQNRWARVYLIGGLILLLTLIGIIAFLVTDRQPETIETELDPIDTFEPMPLGEQWFESRQMDVKVSDSAAVSFGTNLYVIGGKTIDGDPSAQVAIYQPLLKVWNAGPDKPTAVYGAAGVELGGRIYVVGGIDQSEAPTEISEVFSPLDSLWGQIEPLPTATADGLTVSDGSFLYYIGGMTAAGATAESYLFDPESNRWRPLPPLPEARTALAGGYLTGRIYAVGGDDLSGNPTADCFIFDIDNEAWDLCASALEPRTNAGAVILQNKLYLLGGETEADFGELFNPESGTWEFLPQPMISAEQTNWSGPAVASVENRIYAFGGVLGESAIDQTFLYRPLIFQTFIPSAASDGE